MWASVTPDGRLPALFKGKFQGGIERRQDLTGGPPKPFQVLASEKSRQESPGEFFGCEEPCRANSSHERIGDLCVKDQIRFGCRSSWLLQDHHPAGFSGFTPGWNQDVMSPASCLDDLNRCKRRQ